MKVLLFVIALALAGSCQAQGFFKKDPIPVKSERLGVAGTPITQNSFHPLVGVAATTSDGSTLSGGFGIGFFHRKWDDPSQSYTTQYSFSGFVFLDTKASVKAGLAIGFLGIMSLGWDYNFAFKSGEIITGVSFTPF